MFDQATLERIMDELARGIILITFSLMRRLGI